MCASASVGGTGVTMPAMREQSADDATKASDTTHALHIALLRGVNVGGRTKVAMADLRAMLAELGFAEGRTLLQSGNLVFRGDGRKSAALEQLLEAETAKRLDLRTDYFVRTADEWAAVVAANPFADEAKRDPGKLVVLCLKDAPAAKQVETLRDAIKGPETVQADGRQLYIVYPDGIGRSKLTTTLIESKLGTRGTGRNWNTVLKLAALVSE
jgi:uncharacterized protein (DUF1697 family)